MEKKRNNRLNKLQPQTGLSSSLDKHLFTLFSSFSKKPENKDKSRIDLVKDFVTFYNIKEPLGLLEKMSGEINITFDTIKSESFSLHDILEQGNKNKYAQSANIHNMLSKMGIMGKNVEEIIISLFTKKIREQVPEHLKNAFDERFSHIQTKTLNSFRSAIEIFFDEHDSILWKTNITVNNEEIKEALLDKKLIEKKDVAGTFNKRTGTTRKVFDKLVSHQKLSHLQETIAGVEQQTNSLGSCLGSIPTIKDIIAPYFKGKNIFEEGEHAQEIHDIQEKIAATENEEEETKLRKELYSLQWRILLEDIKKKDSELASALTQLLDKEFDFSLLDKAHQKTLLKEIQNHYADTFINTGTYKLLGLEKHEIFTFLNELFDLEKKSLHIPLAGTDGLNLSVQKGFVAGKMPGYLNLTEIDNLSSLPFSIDIDINNKEDAETFEHTRNLVFGKHFITFHAKNGDFRIHEGYKIKVDGKHEGYLHYQYLYDEQGNHILDDNGNEIMFDDETEKNHMLEILDKTLRVQGNDVSEFMQSLWLGKTPLTIETLPTQQDKKTIENLFTSLQGKSETYTEEIVAAKEAEKERIEELVFSGEKNEKRKRAFETTIAEIKANAILGDQERIHKAIETLHQEGIEGSFSTNDLKGIAILESHRVGKLTLGKDKRNLACIFNYTDEQLKKKIQILKNAGFTSWEVKILLEDGICGEVNDIENAKFRAEEILSKLDTTSDIEIILDTVWEDFKERDKHTRQAFIDTIEEKKSLLSDNNKIEQINNFISVLTTRFERLGNKDYDALVAAFEEFKRDPAYKQKTWGLFINFLKIKKGQKPGNYYGYKGDEIVLSNDLSRLTKPVKEVLPLESPEESDEDNNTPPTDHDEGREKTPETNDDFMEALNQLPGHPEWKLEAGARLWFKSPLESKLPPDTGSSQWCQIEIVSVHENTRTLKMKVTGGELPLGSMEGKIIELPMNKETLENLGNDVYKLLPPNKNFTQQLKDFKVSGTDLKDVSILEDDISRESNKFKFNSGENKGEEVVAFGSEDFLDFDEKKGGEQRQKILYNVKHNSNNTFTIDAEYIGFDDGGEKQKFGYKQTMDYNSFMIFIANKKLKPKTKEEAAFEKHNFDQQAQKALGGKKWKFFGLAHILGAFKDIPKKIKEGLKKYQEKQKDEFTDFLVSDFGIYNKLNFLLGWSADMKDAITNIQTEYYNERDGKVWKKVEVWLKRFEADPDFGDSWGKKGYGKIVENGTLPKDPHMAGALLLANIGPGGGPYSRLPAYRMKGQWVKLMLGEGHHARFMQMQKEHIEKMKNEKDAYGGSYDADLVNELTRCEMTYLINNIGGRAPGAPFGSMMDDTGPKRMWSDKFAGELEKRYNEWSSRGAIEERYGKLKHITNFNFCYNEYKRYLHSGRSQHALAFFKRMAVLAKSPQQIQTLKMGMVYGLVTSGFLLYADKATKGLIEEISRSMGFAPGLLVQHQNHPGKVAKLLDRITDGKFSKDTSFNQKDFGPDGPENNKTMDNYIKKFEKFWYSDNNGKKICNFLKDLPKMDVSNESSLIQQVKNLTLEEAQENSDPDVAKNKSIIVDSVLTIPKGLINTMVNYKDGTFVGKDNDEIQAAQKFWNNVANEIKKTKPKELPSFMKIFLNWFSDKGFDETSKESFIRKLATVKRYKNKPGRSEEAKDALWYSIVGEITLNTGRGAPPQEFKKALLAFMDVFRNNIDNIKDDTINHAFGRRYVDIYNNKPYLLIPWKEYNRVMSRNPYAYDDDEYLSEGPRKDTRTKEQKEEDRDKASKYRNQKDLYLNIEMKEQERGLTRKGWCPPLSEKVDDNVYVSGDRYGNT